MNRNQTEFEDSTRKSIWHARMFIAPLCSAEQGEKSFYDFICNLYSDIYNDPEKYYIPAGEYDDYMNGSDIKSEQKESKLRNSFQRSIQFYQKLLFEIGAKSEIISDDILKFNKKHLDDMINPYNLRILRGEEMKRLMALSNVGLDIEDKENEVIITNRKYPHMFEALCALARSKNKKYAMTNFLRCDFRGLDDKFKPGFNDAACILPEKYRNMAEEMNTVMDGLDCKIAVEPLKDTTLYSKWKVSYKYKGSLIYSFHADTDSFEIFAYFNDYKNISKAGYYLKENSEEMYNWFYDRVKERTCTCKNNRIADIGGIKKRICGLMNRMEVSNPNIDEFEKFKEIIDMNVKNDFLYVLQK